MKCVKIDLDKGLKEIDVDMLADMHIGSPRCDEKAIRAEVEKIRTHKNLYCIISGDVVNNSTTHSVGDTYEEELTPMQQIQHAVRLLEPIKDKILGVVSGNHEKRSYKSEGIDLLYFMCCELGIAERYDPVALLLFIRLGQHKNLTRGNGDRRKILYTLYMSHGSSGGRTKGAKVNGLHRTRDIVDADIITQGHTHDPICFKSKRFCVDTRNNTVNEQQQCFINSSSFLKYEAYAETYGFPPASNDIPSVVLSGTEKNITMTL